MTQQALARRHRPLRFTEVTAQDHVSETLMRAVAGDRVGHAYLFCGPRGVGKTTLARVLAMALNCPQRTPDGEPCGECDSCRRIWSGQTALDVVEIDAASNRGVDDARDLRERAMYAPSEDGRFKVYIVDEAHMLTREAWNALLKILEEPPPRVIFVFATTEPQKIQQAAAPILSRCQRFDFRRISVAAIMGRLAEVLRREGMEAPEEALRIIARRAEGGMRDALSLLDQVLALTGGDIGADEVRRVLGLVEDERYLELLGVLAEKRHGEVFTFVEAVLDEGYDLVEFYHGWVDVLRTLLRMRLGGPAAEVREDLVGAFTESAEGYSPADLVRMLSMSSELESTGSLRRSGEPRLILEMLLLRLSYLDRTVEIEALLRELGGAPAPPRGDDPGPGSGGERARTPGSEASARVARRAGRVPAGGRAAGESAGEGPAAKSEDAEPAPPPAEGLKGLEGLKEAWTRVQGESRSVLPGMGPFLRVATVLESEPGVVQVSVPSGPGRERLSEAGNRRVLAEALSSRLGRRVEVVLTGDDGPLESAAPVPRVTPEAVLSGRLKELLEREPLLGHAVEELDLEMLE